MNLRWRLTAVIGGTVALMIAGASLLAYVSADRELNRQVDEFLLSRAREAEQTAEETWKSVNFIPSAAILSRYGVL